MSWPLPSSLAAAAPADLPRLLDQLHRDDPGLHALLLHQVSVDEDGALKIGLSGPNKFALGVALLERRGVPLERVRSLSVHYSEAVNLDGLRRLTGLRSLEINSNGNLTNVDGLTALAGLRSLTLVLDQEGGSLDLTPITTLRQLERLVLEDDFEDEDFAFLAGMPALREVSLQVEGRVSLPALRHVRTLTLGMDDEASLDGLRALSGLRELSLFQVRYSGGYAFLEDLSGLTRLQLVAHAPMRDLSPLAGLTALRSLNIPVASGADLSPLRGLTALRELSLGSKGTGLLDLSPLMHAADPLPALEDLRVYGAPMHQLVALAARLPGLRSLTLSHTGELVRVDLSPLAALGALRSLRLRGIVPERVPPLPSVTELSVGGHSECCLPSLGPLAVLTGVETLELGVAPADGDFSPLACLPRLRTFTLRDGGDLDFSGLRCPELEALHLVVVKINNLPPLPKLRTAFLDEVGSRGLSFDTMAEMHALESLVLFSGHKELSGLASAPALRSLHLSSQRPEAVQGDWLSTLSTLESLDLSCLSLESLPALPPALRHLSINRGVPLTPADLDRLSHLRSLTVNRLRVESSASIAALVALCAV